MVERGEGRGERGQDRSKVESPKSYVGKILGKRRTCKVFSTL